MYPLTPWEKTHQTAHDAMPLAEEHHEVFATSTFTSPSHPNVPFAVIDSVLPSSPSHDAGLQRDDRLLAFGPISLDSFQTPRQALNAIPGLLKQMRGRPIDVVIERHEAYAMGVLHFALTPRRWLGLGLLGCQVSPIVTPKKSQSVPVPGSALPSPAVHCSLSNKS